MSQFTIRLYKDSDRDMVRRLFAASRMEHVNGAFRNAFQLPHIYLTLLALLFLPLLSTTLVTTCIAALILVIVYLWLGARYMFRSFSQKALSGDLLDIKKYYLERDGHCFWVAELRGEVVGTVAALPASFPSDKKHLEIKRLSVSKNHRRQGIARALVMTIVDFARKRGCEAVIATTTSAQNNAQQMYKNLEFRLIHVFIRPMPFRKLLGLKSLTFQYDI